MTTLTLASTSASDIERLRAAGRLRALAEAAEAEAIAALAISTGWVSEDQYPETDVVGRRLVRVGEDGLPIDETLPLEVAVAQGTSVGRASFLIRDIVNLRARHPQTWQAVCDRRVPLWHAQGVAQACVGYDLTPQQARAVDAAVAPALGRVPAGRLIHLAQAAIMRLAPAAVRAQTRRLTKTRYCRTQTCPADPSTSYLEAAIDTADAIYLDATVDRLADILRDQGNTAPKDARRATALGILATPAYALSLLGVHTRRHLEPDQTVPEITPQMVRRALPVAQVYVHLSDDTLVTRKGVVRVEDIGPALVSQVSKIVGHGRVRVTPVLRIGAAEAGIDAYEIPERLRAHVVVRDRYEAFPYSSRNARRQDIDHTIPYHPGEPEQTRPANLGALSRRVHRAKTFGGWTLEQPEPGVFIWRSRLGQAFRVGPDGTTRLDTS